MAEEQKKVEKHLTKIRNQKEEKTKTKVKTTPKITVSPEVQEPQNASFQANEDILKQLEQIQLVLLRKQQKLRQKL